MSLSTYCLWLAFIWIAPLNSLSLHLIGLSATTCNRKCFGSPKIDSILDLMTIIINNRSMRWIHLAGMSTVALNENIKCECTKPKQSPDDHKKYSETSTLNGCILNMIIDGIAALTLIYCSVCVFIKKWERKSTMRIGLFLINTFSLDVNIRLPFSFFFFMDLDWSFHY